MNKTRVETLSDGIFAIVMTLLIIEIKVPELEHFSEHGLQEGLIKLIPLFLSFFLSFAIITSTWVTHHFLFTTLAKNINRNLLYLNMLFMSFVCLLPFSSHLLGTYPESQLGVAFYSVNVMIIGGMIYLIREYVTGSKSIENNELNKFDKLYGKVRIMLTTGLPLLAIGLSYINTYFSIVVLISSVLINVTPGLVAWCVKVTGLDSHLRN
ncbi:MAG: TMEM175 family protein [bacterium]